VIALGLNAYDHHSAVEEGHAGNLLVLVQVKAQRSEYVADQTSHLLA